MTSQILDNVRKYIATFIHSNSMDEDVWIQFHAPHHWSPLLRCESQKRVCLMDFNMRENISLFDVRDHRSEITEMRAQGSLSDETKTTNALHLSHVPLCSCHTNGYIIAHWFDAFSHLGRGCRTTDSKRERMPRALALTEIENVKKWIVEMGKLKFKSKSFSF